MPSSELQGVRQYQELIDLELLKMGAFVAAEMTPHRYAASVTMPVMIVQVLKDSWTSNPEDAQKTFDLLGTKDKELFWIENTTQTLQGWLQLLRQASGNRPRLLRQAYEVRPGIRLAAADRNGEQSVTPQQGFVAASRPRSSGASMPE
jgi:hypothetical protein